METTKVFVSAKRNDWADLATSVSKLKGANDYDRWDIALSDYLKGKEPTVTYSANVASPTAASISSTASINTLRQTSSLVKHLLVARTSTSTPYARS